MERKKTKGSYYNSSDVIKALDEYDVAKNLDESDRVKASAEDEDHKATTSLREQVEKHVRSKVPGNGDAIDEVPAMAFEELYRRAEAVRASKKPGGYMHNIVHHETIDHLRYAKRMDGSAGSESTTSDFQFGSRKPRPSIENFESLGEEPISPVDAALSPDDEVAAKELVERLIDMMPERYRDDWKAFKLYIFEPRSYADVGELMDEPENTIKTRIRRFRQHLRDEALKAGYAKHDLVHVAIYMAYYMAYR
jgi:RNA polymerase sigma factor (sigma-70 family)